MTITKLRFTHKKFNFSLILHTPGIASVLNTGLHPLKQIDITIRFRGGEGLSLAHSTPALPLSQEKLNFYNLCAST